MHNPHLPWNTDSAAIPMEKPVLVRAKAEIYPHAERDAPVMCIREHDDPGVLCMMLDDQRYGGFYIEMDDVLAWLDVLA